MRRFLSPGWLLAHVVVAGVVTTCVALGLWQLDRLEQRRSRNATIERRSAMPPVPLRDLVEGDGDRFAYRRVEVRGTYDVEREVVLVGRSLDGASGNHVLTPLVSQAGWGIVVERGWVPSEMRRPPVPARPPSGEVRVEGIVLPAERMPGPPPTGGSELMHRLDVSWVQARTPYRLQPFAMRLTAPSPSPDALPAIVPPPETSEGPHLSYAVQWFLFAAIAIVVYAALVRKELRGRGDGAPEYPRRDGRPVADPRRPQPRAAGGGSRRARARRDPGGRGKREDDDDHPPDRLSGGDRDVRR